MFAIRMNRGGLTKIGTVDNLLELGIGAAGGDARLNGGKHGGLIIALTGKVETVTSDCWGSLEIAWLGALGDVGEGNAEAVLGENALGEEDGASEESEGELHCRRCLACV